MPSISNVRTGPAPAPAIEAEATPVVAAPASRVTVIDERHASVVDSRGRTIKVKKLSALDRVKLFRALGATDSENRMLGSYASTAASVVELEGVPVPFPSTSLQLDALIGRLDEHGLEAAIRGLIAVSVDQDVAAEAKGF
jgi:hypothetical protein